MRLVSFSYENAGQGRLEAGVATFGHVFAKGEMPTGTALSATINGSSSAVQMDVKTTYEDGSVKMAVLSALRPELQAGASVEAVLSTGSAGGVHPPIDLSSALSGHSFSVAITPSGGAARSIDVLAALRTALADGSASFWQSGPLATQARVEIPLEGSQRLVFDVTAYKGGGFSVDAGFNNDGAMGATGGRVAYGVTVRMDGRTVAQEQVNQGQYQNWHRSFSSNGSDGGQGLGDPAEGWLNIRHDISHLGDTGAVAEYNLANGVEGALLDTLAEAAQAAGVDAPLATAGVTQYMPGTGGRIGTLPVAYTSWSNGSTPLPPSSRSCQCTTRRSRSMPTTRFSRR